MFFIICGISSSCHSYSTATWNSCSTVQKKRQRICWSLSQAIRAYLSRESSLNWMDPMYFLTTDSSFVGAVYLGQSRCFITIPQEQMEGLWSSTSSAFHSSLLENSGWEILKVMEKEEGLFPKTSRSCECKDKGNSRVHKKFLVHPLHSSAGRNSAAISC